jgi:hypothetical protein
MVTLGWGGAAYHPLEGDGRWVPVSYGYDEKTDEWGPTAWGPAPKLAPELAPKLAPKSAPGTVKQGAAEEAEKAALLAVMNTLCGDMEVVPSDGVIALQSGDAIKASGLGKYLSGRYFVKSVRRSITAEGYAQTLNVVKTGFGDYVKMEENVEEGSPSEETRQTPGAAKNN